MEAQNLITWEFANVFKSFQSKISFVIDILDVFENFPPDTRLNCDDYYSIFSVMCENIPYQFIVFVCECVDPSISSGTLLAHKVAFGNFLLALPCCILFPQFMHKLLTLFKASDKLRSGIISRSLFLSILNDTFAEFVNTTDEQESDDENEEDENNSEKETKVQHTTTLDPQNLPDFSMIDEVQRATSGLDEASVQTLLFIMWQKDPTLLMCKSRIRPEDPASASNDATSQASQPV